MKKFLVLSFMFAASVIALPTIAEAKSTAITTSAEPRIRGQIGQDRRGRWNNRRTRTETRTRIVRTRMGSFREVVRITYHPNGRTTERVISRTRVRR